MPEFPENQPGNGSATERMSVQAYRRFGREVFELSLAHQRYEGVRQMRPLSDAEIAARLGLTEAEVAEVRCVAETDLLSPDWFREADRFKRGRVG